MLLQRQAKQIRCIHSPTDCSQESAAVVNDAKYSLQPVLIGAAKHIEQRSGGKKDSFSQPQDGAPSSAQMPIHVILVVQEPAHPAVHGFLAGIILGILILRTDDSIQHPGDDFCRIVLVRSDTIRQLIMDEMALFAAQPANNEVYDFAAFQPANAFAGIPVA